MHHLKHQVVSKEQKHSERTAQQCHAQWRAQIDCADEFPSPQQCLLDAQPDEPPDTSLDIPEGSMRHPDYFHTEMSIMQDQYDHNIDDYM